MAGYIFTVGKEINILDAMKKGVFSTNLKFIQYEFLDNELIFKELE